MICEKNLSGGRYTYFKVDELYSTGFYLFAIWQITGLSLLILTTHL